MTMIMGEGREVNLDNDTTSSKNVQITFILKNRQTCGSFSLICVVIGDKCKEEYIGEIGEGKSKQRESQIV